MNECKSGKVTCRGLGAEFCGIALIPPRGIIFHCFKTQLGNWQFIPFRCIFIKFIVRKPFDNVKSPLMPLQSLPRPYKQELKVEIDWVIKVYLYHKIVLKPELAEVQDL